MEKPIPIPAFRPDLLDTLEFVKQQARELAETDELEPVLLWETDSGRNIALIRGVTGTEVVLKALQSVLIQFNPLYFVLVHEAWAATPKAIDQYRKQIDPEMTAATIPLDDRSEQVVIMFGERKQFTYITVAKIMRQGEKRIIGEYEPVGILAGRHKDTHDLVREIITWPE